jgi:hypothetical protein
MTFEQESGYIKEVIDVLWSQTKIESEFAGPFLQTMPLKACFIRRILVAWNTIKTIDNEMINLIKLHYLLFKLHSTRPKFDV